MKLDVREIQALKKGGGKYNKYDVTISRYLLMLKVEGYDVSNIKNYDQLLEIMNDYNIVYDKNIEGSIQKDIEKAVKEGISINKELLDDILMEYDKYLSVKQVKEKLRDGVYKTYQKIISNEKANKFAKEVAEKELENIKDTIDSNGTENFKNIIEEEIKSNLDNKTKKKSLKDILGEIQENKERELNKKTRKIEDLLREIIDPEGEEKREEFLKENAEITEKFKREKEKLRESNPDIVEKFKDVKLELIKNNKDLALRFEEDRNNLIKDYGVLNKKELFDKIRSENPELVEKLIKKQVEILANKAKEINSEVNVPELKEDLSSFYNQALDDGISFKKLSSEIKAKIGIKDKDAIEKLSNKILAMGGYEEIAKDPFFLKEFGGSILGQKDVLEKAINIYYNSEDSDFKDKLVNIGLPENEANILFKRINLQADNYLKQNEEEAKLLRRDAFGKRLSDGFTNINEGFNMEQEIAFRKYRNFLADSFYPEDGFFKSIGTDDWLNAYKQIKGDLLESGLKLPYEMKEVIDADKWAKAFENPNVLNQATRQQRVAQFWNNFNERTGGVFKNFSSNFQGRFNGFVAQSRDGIGGSFRQFFGGGERSGASPFMSGLKNIGNTLGQGAQNGARNILQGANNGIGSMLKGLGGKLGGFGAGGAKGTGMAAKGGLAVAKGLGALLAGGGGVAVIGIIVIIIFIFILIYSMSLNQNLTSSLVPNTYGSQVGDEEDKREEIIKTGCYVIRNGIKLPVFADYTNNDVCGTSFTNKKCNDNSNVVYSDDYCSSYLTYASCQEGGKSVEILKKERCYMDAYIFDIYKKMYEDAKKDGINVELLKIDWGYRSYYWQEIMKQHWTCLGEPGNAATPGESGHQSGRALDFRLNDRNNDAYKWLAKNAGNYGFYECGSGKLPTCNLSTEPWHWEYRFVPSSSDEVICDVEKKDEKNDSSEYSNKDPFCEVPAGASGRVCEIKRTYKPEYIIVHHTAIPNDTFVNSDASVWVNKYKTNSPHHTEDGLVINGYQKQGYVVDYNVLIDKKGNKAEGTPEKYWSINAGNNYVNFRSLAVSLIGNYQSTETITKSDAVYNTLIKQIKEWVDKYDISYDKVLSHTCVLEVDDPHLKDIYGTVKTNCPGSRVLLLWEDIIKDVFPEQTNYKKPDCAR